jgi:D-lactate dehydrogenase (cytochrome)
MPERPHLFLEFHGSQNGVAEQSEMAGAIMAEHGGGDFQWTTKAEDRSALWKMRHNAYYAAKALRPGCRVLTTDVCVPISRLAEAVTETRADIDASGIEGPMLGHVGDGNFHCALLVDPDRPEELKIAEDLAHRMNRRALRLGGTVTGEHGVGRGKMKYMAEEHGDALAVMAAIKRALDPQGILNPGKIVPVN